MTLTIEYDRSKCIGARKCTQAAHGFFIWDGKKAVLKNAAANKELQLLTIECTQKQAEQFIKAATSCPVNAIKVTDETGVVVGTEIITHDVREVIADYDDNTEFVLDPKGYFLIRINSKAKNIEVGFCNSRNKVTLKVVGKKPIEIYQTIINQINLDIRKDHCAYLGRELQKAYIALQRNIPYVQDEELDL